MVTPEVARSELVSRDAVTCVPVRIPSVTDPIRMKRNPGILARRRFRIHARHGKLWSAGRSAPPLPRLGQHDRERGV